jgi:hypothetical protein
MKGRSPAAYALALRGTGKAMKHRNTPRGGRSNELANLQAAAEEELREETREAEERAQALLTGYYQDRRRPTREEAERLAREAAERYGVDIPGLGVVHSKSGKETA